MTTAVILYGPPASGKDTITRHLIECDSRYAHFQRLKVGPGRKHGYRIIASEELTARTKGGDIVYSNTRYQSTYAVDRSELDSMIGRGKIPVLHLGQTSGIEAMVGGYALDWLVVGLWCSRVEVARRLSERHDDRTDERLAAWDTTAVDARSADPGLFGLAINTELIPAGSAANLIDSCCRLPRTQR
jgi:guanylate kinase